MRKVGGCFTIIAPFLLLSLSACKNAAFEWTSSLVNEISGRPYVTRVEALQTGRFNGGDELRFRVYFSERVVVDASGGSPPSLSLRTSSSITRQTTFVSAHPEYLEFKYVVITGDNTSVLNYENRGSLDLNSYSIVSEEDGEAADTQLPELNDADSLMSANITLDTTLPTVAYVTANPLSGNIEPGDEIEIRVFFSEPINYSNSMSLVLNNSVTTYLMDPAPEIVAENEIVFYYLVGTDENINNLDYAATAALSGPVVDKSGNISTNELPALNSANSLAGRTNINIVASTGTLAKVTNVRTTNVGEVARGIGEEVAVVVSFDKSIAVTNGTIASILLNSNSNARAYYSADSDHASSEFTFNYEVGTGDSANILNYSSSSDGSSAYDARIAISSGSMKDAALNQTPNLVLPADIDEGSLLSNYETRSNSVSVVNAIRPDAPINFQVYFAGHTTSLTADDRQLELRWDHNSSVENYLVERAEGASSFSAYSSASANNYFTDADVDAEGTYHYRIRANNNGLVSGYTPLRSGYVHLVTPITCPQSSSVSSDSSGASASEPEFQCNDIPAASMPQSATNYAYWNFDQFIEDGPTSYFPDQKDSTRRGTFLSTPQSQFTSEEFVAGEGAAKFDNSSSQSSYGYTAPHPGTEGDSSHTARFSLSIWINPLSAPTTNSEQIIASLMKADVGEAGWKLTYRDVDGKKELCLMSTNNSLTYGCTIPNPLRHQEWQHIGVSQDATTQTFRVYIDGIDSTLYSIPQLSSSVPYLGTFSLGYLFGIGVTPDHGFFHGLVDDLAVWKAPLSRRDFCDIIEAQSNQTLCYGPGSD